jgi:hypothetical protein
MQFRRLRSCSPDSLFVSLLLGLAQLPGILSAQIDAGTLGSSGAGTQLTFGASSSSGAIIIVNPSRPKRQGAYLYQGLWYIDAWPRPVTDIVEVPRARFVCAELETPEPIRSLRAGRGEFYLLEETGRLRVDPAQHPGEQTLIDGPPVPEGENDFVVADGVVLPSADGLVQVDPGVRLLTPFVDEPAITPDQPLVFLHQNAIRPGITYRHSGDPYTNRAGYSAVPNTGLLLPRPPGQSSDVPLRAHTLHKVISTYGSPSVALGTLHPDTPGYSPGTQALFRTDDVGVTWTFTPLPANGRWHDIAITDLTGFRGITPYHNQVVIVGDAGIYTSMGPNGPWKHIASNTTAANPGDITLSFPIPGPDDPLTDTVPLRLRSVTWARDRFVAAGVTGDTNATPIVVEGASTFWFAYPLVGWPSDRTVDEIVAFDDRRLLLSRATGEKPALLFANQPLYAPQGTPPSLSGPALVTPALGTTSGTTFYPTGPITRYIVEKADGGGRQDDWHISGDDLRYSKTLWFSRPGSGTYGYNYVTDSTPVRLRITPVNEFGRGAPIEVDIRPQAPGFITPAPVGTPRLSVPTQTRAVLGSAVKIPIRDLDPKVNWWRHHTWFYELPEGLYFDEYQEAIMGHVLETGVHEIRILAINEGGVSWTGPLTLTVPEPKPKPTDIGNFSGLLDGDDALSGLWHVTLRANRTFTGRVNLLGSSHSFRGTLVPVVDQQGLLSAETVIKRGKRAPLELKLTLDSLTGRLALHARAGDEEASTAFEAIAHAPWAGDRQSPRSGRYTARIAPPSGDSAPFAGNGFLRLVVAKNGLATIQGELATGLRWTASSTISADGAIPILWKPESPRSLRGMLSFSDENLSDDRFTGTLEWRTSRAEKCPDYGPAAELAVDGHRVAILASGEDPLHSGGLNRVVLTHPELARFGHPDGRAEAVFQPNYFPKLWPAHDKGDTAELSATLSLGTETGLASGQITLTGSDGKKHKIQLRAISLYADDENEGRLFGHFLLPASDGKTFLSGRLVSEPMSY